MRTRLISPVALGNSNGIPRPQKYGPKILCGSEVDDSTGHELDNLWSLISYIQRRKRYNRVPRKEKEIQYRVLKTPFIRGMEIQ